MVLNKSDLASRDARLVEARGCERGRATAGGLAVSALTGAGLDGLLLHLQDTIAARLERTAEVALPTQARHRTALIDCMTALARATDRQTGDAELFAEELRLASDALGRITGKVDAEAVLGLIFGRFCIGK